MQTAYRDLGYNQGDLPITEAVADSILSLPMFPHMSQEMVDFVCSDLKNVVEGSMEAVRTTSGTRDTDQTALGKPNVVYDLLESHVRAGDAALYARPDDDDESCSEDDELGER